MVSKSLAGVSLTPPHTTLSHTLYQYKRIDDTPLLHYQPLNTTVDARQAGDCLASPGAAARRLSARLTPARLPVRRLTPAQTAA